MTNILHTETIRAVKTNNRRCPRSLMIMRYYFFFLLDAPKGMLGSDDDDEKLRTIKKY